jgi:hypothetical protein
VKIKSFENIHEEDFVVSIVRNFDPICEPLVGTHINESNEGVEASMEGSAEFLSVHTNELTRTSWSSHWSVAGGDGGVVHTPNSTNTTLGESWDHNVINVERKIFDMALRNEIPETLISHMIEALVPQKEGKHSLRV